MRFTLKRLADGTNFQVVMEAQNDDEDEIIHELYLRGSIIALGETTRGHRQLVLGTAPEDSRFRSMSRRGED